MWAPCLGVPCSTTTRRLPRDERAVTLHSRTRYRSYASSLVRYDAKIRNSPLIHSTMIYIWQNDLIEIVSWAVYSSHKIKLLKNYIENKYWQLIL